MNLQVLFEDTELIVCYKPAGVPTQTSKIGSADMVSLLKNYLYKNQKEKREPYVAVVHRLDQPVEGILVFAKTPFAAKGLSRQVQDGGFGKYYKAVLSNIPKEKAARVENYLLKDGRTNTSKVCDASVQHAKKSVLYYEVIKVSAEEEDIRCLVKIKLKTGRHHQIRVQMAHMGCPIWGDTKYNRLHREDGKRRQTALCAYHLEFRHPKTGELMEFEIEPRGEGFNLEG